MRSFKGDDGFVLGFVWKFRNITGKPINLKITKFENATEYAIKTDFSNNFRIPNFLVLLIILLLNFLALSNTSLNPLYSGCVFICDLIYFYRTVKTVQKESLLVANGLGYQIDIHYVVGRKTMFIPWTVIDTIFINEVISKHRVIFVLTLFAKENEDSRSLIPLFVDTLPRLDCLRVIYEDIKKND